MHTAKTSWSDQELQSTHYLVSIIELIVHESSDDTSFADRLIPQEDKLIFSQSWDRRH